MIRQTGHILLAMIWLLILMGTTAADEITINVDRNYPPYMYDENGVAKGIYTEIIRKVFSDLGHTVKIEAIPWKRLIKELDEAKSGGGGLYLTEERTKKYHFSMPIYRKRLVVYTKRGSGINVSSLADLKGLKVGTIYGWSYPKKIREAIESKQFENITAKSEKINMKWLAKGRLDAVIAVLESVEMSSEKWGLSGQLKQGAVLKVTNIYIAFNKKAGKKELLKRFDKAFLKLKKAGAFKNTTR